MVPKRVRIIATLPLQYKMGGVPTQYNVGDEFDIERAGITPDGLIAEDGTILLAGEYEIVEGSR